MFGQIGTLLVETIIGLIVYLALIRFYMQAFRAPFRNPVGQFVVAFTDWGVQPLRKVLPGWRGLDLASLVFAIVLQLIMVALTRAFIPGRSLGMGDWLLISMLGLIGSSIHLIILVVLIDFVLSWVNPYTPIAPVLAALTRPFYGFFRRFIPPIGGFDLSPLLVILACQVALIVLNHVGRPMPG
ncbi:MAG: YggT family protein [Betaproteobacteria bacterium]|nr:YggT family protein [Betaproteobacteria bacterium]